MCGIGGIVRITPPGEPFEPIPEAWADALDAHIAWRGPDGAGRFRDKVERTDGSIVEVVLVHRRLSIIDHEGGAQPMVWRGPALGGTALRAVSSRSEAGPEDTARRAVPPRNDNLIALVFNGCIYNHREIRAELESYGCRFASDHADGEVVLQANVAMQERRISRRDKLPDAEGMCAFAVWESSVGSAYIGRDRFGEKPLYFATVPERSVHVVASTVEGVARVERLAGVGQSEPRVQRATLTDWVALGFSDAPPIEGVTALAPGAVWRLPAPVEFPDSIQRAKEKDGEFSTNVLTFAVVVLAAAILAAAGVLGFVKNTILPVVIGVAWLVLIAGLGWVAWLTLAARRQRRRSSRIRSRRRGALITTLDENLSNSVANRLDADVPIGCFLSGGIDSSLIAYYANQARPGITTLCVRMPDERYDESQHAQRVADILGTNHITVDCAQDPAGDLVHIIETLGLPFGDSSILPTYWLCKAARQHIKVALSGDGGDELFMGYERHRVAGLLGWSMLLPMLWMPRLDETDPASRSSKKARFLRAARGRGYVDLVSIFDSTDLRRLIRGKRKGTGAMDQVYGRAAARRWDLAHYLPDDLLRKTDTASMLCGLEVRAPFLDSAVADFALSLPPRVHLAKGETKHLLRELARRHFPPEITERPKQGFAIPIGEWFRTDHGGMRTLLRERLAAPEPFGIAHQALDFNMDYVHQMLDEHDEAGRGGGAAPSGTRGRDHSQRLYMLLVLAIWGQAGAAPSVR